MKTKNTNRNVRPSLTYQAMTWLMVVLQGSVAVLSLAGAAATVPLSAPTGREPHLSTSTTIVKANRSLPLGVAKAAAPVSFSVDPTEQDILNATILEQPLVPVGGRPTATDNRRLVRALESYLHRSNPDDVSPLS